jgi:hypothetical protein
VFAFVFLAKGAVEPLSGFDWPTPRVGEPGVWVSRDTASSEALRGYPAGDLPYWLDEELWNVELAGTLTERDHLLLAERARLLGIIDAWRDAAAWELVAACAQRVAYRAAAALRADGQGEAAVRLDGATDLADLELAGSSAAHHAGPAGTLAGHVADICAYARDAGVAAHGAGIAAKMSAYALAGEVDEPRQHDERLAEERAWQAAWLVDRLGL